MRRDDFFWDGVRSSMRPGIPGIMLYNVAVTTWDPCSIAMLFQCHHGTSGCLVCVSSKLVVPVWVFDLNPRITHPRLGFIKLTWDIG
jgi:hypothetical protein